MGNNDDVDHDDNDVEAKGERGRDLTLLWLESSNLFPPCTTMLQWICANRNMYLYKLQNVFFQNTNCILPNFKRYLKKEKTRRDSDWNPPIFFPVQCNASMNLCKLENVFFQIKNCIFSNFKRYWKKEKTRLDSDWNRPIFFPYTAMLQWICANRKMYFSKLQNVFVQIINCIFPNCKICLKRKRID